MLGAIIGDIVSSRFELNNIKTKEFTLFTNECFFTVDSVMTLAVCDAIMKSKGYYYLLDKKAKESVQKIGKCYLNCGCSNDFKNWLFSSNPAPNNCYGCDDLIFVSACAFAAESLEEAIYLSNQVTKALHNHMEGIKEKEAITVAIYLAKSGKTKSEIKEYINNNYYEIMHAKDEMRLTDKFNETYQKKVREAIIAFLESNSFEDAIRNAVFLGSDSYKLAAITGSIAEAYYGVCNELRKKALSYLDDRLIRIYLDFENEFIRK